LCLRPELTRCVYRSTRRRPGVRAVALCASREPTSRANS
jgi:hypothetical protein